MMNSASKILSASDLECVINSYHRQGIGIAFTNGCFDCLHRGHVHLLETAAEHGVLFVGVNSDASVRRLKGPTRPINVQEDRAAVIASLQCVKAVFIVIDVRVDNIIRRLRPTYWLKGGDYTLDTLDKGEVEAAKEVGAEIILVPALPGYSTTKIVEKIC